MSDPLACGCAVVRDPPDATDSERLAIRLAASCESHRWRFEALSQQWLDAELDRRLRDAARVTKMAR